MKYYYGTKDSYHEGNMKTATPIELAEIITSTEEYNRYYGGKENTISATIDYYKQGYIFKKNMTIYGSKEEFKELEEQIKDHMEYFTPREYEKL